ncbi:hypothetical protein [Rhodopseudomonas telluris]|uniref:EamA domain-containing protein n=1 Tax=Rhodopseudomonas telluris TaxID=644215 RepID=A0ABV6EXF5_9BRAD
MIKSRVHFQAARTARSLHSLSLLFSGQASAPVGLALVHLGKAPTILVAAVIVIGLAIACTKQMRVRRPADDATSAPDA